jgi:hypothetical protein
MTTATKRTRQFGMDGIHSDTLLPTGASPSAKRKGGAKYKSNGVIIGSKWKVQTMGDGLNITISKNTGKSWRVEAYVSSLAGALSWLVSQEVRESDLSDLRAVVERNEELRREIIGLAAG